MKDSTDVAAHLAIQARELAAAADLYIRMPKLRRGLRFSLDQLINNLNEDWTVFLEKWREEHGPEK